MTPKQLETNEARWHFAAERKRLLQSYENKLRMQMRLFYTHCLRSVDKRGWEQAKPMLNAVEMPAPVKFRPVLLTHDELHEIYAEQEPIDKESVLTGLDGWITELFSHFESDLECVRDRVVFTRADRAEMGRAVA